MDFGAVGLEGFAGSGSASTTGVFASDAETKQKWYGSGLGLEHQICPSTEDDWRSSKLQKTEDLSARATLLRSNGSVFSDGQPQMLCFSAPKTETSVPFPYLNRSPGYSCGNVNMHGGRGPLTASQWVELEHQALIYKYMDANVPVPSHLLLPIRKAFDSVPSSAFSSGLLRQNTYGWGGFHLGFANSSDPEPGRCRRTDGKKWRCSRDAMADQKYCERHVNRGRHRSRKPVEGQTGHPAAAASGAKLTSSAPVLESGGGGVSGVTNTVAVAQRKLKNLHLSGAGSDLYHNRMVFNKENGSETPKQLLTFGESSSNEFGLVSSDSLLNPSNKSSWRQPQHSLRQFMDNWPEIDPRSDKTRLSISLPLPAPDFMSSTSCPTKEKPTLSPLRLSRELNPGGGCVINEAYQRQAHWIPISWEASMGGPLGEVLHSTNNGMAECKRSSPLNLLTDGWDNSPRLGSSPTGVLQKSSFHSLSNSSTGSSPRAENSKNVCEDPHYSH